jgi:hypothetical protein
MKTIKENINLKEFRKLIINTREMENMRPNRKNNSLRNFLLLCYIGARINELLILKIKDTRQFQQ